MSHHSHRSINISNVLRTEKNNLINILIRSSHVKDSLLLSLQLVRMGLLLLTKATVAKTQQEVVVRIETLGQWKGTIKVNQGKSLI